MHRVFSLQASGVCWPGCAVAVICCSVASAPAFETSRPAHACHATTWSTVQTGCLQTGCLSAVHLCVCAAGCCRGSPQSRMSRHPMHKHAVVSSAIARPASPIARSAPHTPSSTRSPPIPIETLRQIFNPSIHDRDTSHDDQGPVRGWGHCPLTVQGWALGRIYAPAWHASSHDICTA